MSNGMVGFSVSLALYREDEGGRRTPIQSGFRTDIKFSDDEYRMAVIEFDGDLLFPGHSCDAVCTVLLHSEGEIDSLLSLRSTTIVDGPSVIGLIKIHNVLNRENVCWE